MPQFTFNQDTGLIEPSNYIPSPNFNERPANTKISLLVIHNISLPPGQFGGHYIQDFFCNNLDHTQHPFFKDLEGLCVSAHLLIDRQGVVSQFVPLHLRAWHAGQSCFQGQTNCNDFSIGIELEGSDHTPYTEQQYTTLAELTVLITHHYPLITEEHIVGHQEIAPDRKTDPGPAFDWIHFRQRCLACQASML